MWQPRFPGIVVGWLTAAAIAVYFLHDEMAKLGVFGASCRAHGLTSWDCGALPKLAVWLPDAFVYFLMNPFSYDGAADILGAEYALMWLGSPVAYLIAFVAVNYWVWRLKPN